jgi:hypothetical protein
MTHYTFGQVERAIEHNPDFDGWDEAEYAADGTVVLSISVDGETLPVTKVDGFGGEGKGEDIWVVVQVGDQLFRKNGYYASHYGTDWDGSFDEVRSFTQEVIAYETL